MLSLHLMELPTHGVAEPQELDVMVLRPAQPCGSRWPAGRARPASPPRPGRTRPRPSCRGWASRRSATGGCTPTCQRRAESDDTLRGVLWLPGDHIECDRVGRRRAADADQREATLVRTDADHGAVAYLRVEERTLVAGDRLATGVGEGG